MKNKESRPTMTGISLTEHERDIVQEESRRLGLNNFSATLRMIIRAWKELTAPTPPENGNSNEGE